MGATLIVLAAGMGSRFGGPKQIAAVGPSGETLVEYGLFDAVRAGFDHFVFVIREAIRADFETAVLSRFSDKIACSCVLQSIEDLPAGIAVDCAVGRTKPWGTGHAFWTARTAVSEISAVMNADDFYGPASFKILYDSVQQGASACLVPFRLDQTLSDQGGVSRGVCTLNSDGNLEGIRECRDLQMAGGQRVLGKDNASLEPVDLDVDTLVSMNLMGFGPDIWAFLDQHITGFFKDLNPEKVSEYGLPDLLSAWMVQDAVDVKGTDEKWLGMTHASDLETVQAAIRARVDAGDYPERLWA